MNPLTHDTYTPDDFLTPEELCRLLKIPPERYRSDLKLFKRFNPITIAHGHPRFLRRHVMEVLNDEIRRAGITPITKKRL